jgi:hypothetical protein
MQQQTLVAAEVAHTPLAVQAVQELLLLDTQSDRKKIWHILQK